MAEIEAVIDTNVLISARGASHDLVDPLCQLECLRYIRSVQDRGRVHLDSLQEILSEYATYFDYSGQPTAADRFVQWIRQNIANAENVCISTITPDGDRRFVEFPADPDLETFDVSDRKFVATANGCAKSPTIAHAADVGWLVHAQALAAAAIGTKVLCAQTRKVPG